MNVHVVMEHGTNGERKEQTVNGSGAVNKG